MITVTDHTSVVAHYEVESYLPLEQAVAVLAGEQSTGTFVALERETAELKARFAAQLIAMDEIEPSPSSTLPGTRPADGVRRRARIAIRFPFDNFGPSIPALLATVAGNLFEIAQLAAVKLVDLELPAAFAEVYQGPAFGVAGTRRFMGRDEGAMLGTIVKPSLGLSAEDLAIVVSELADAGIDFIKDDELQNNGPRMPLQKRIDAVMPVLHAHADRTGHLPMYAFNVTGDIDEMRRGHDAVVAAGGTCVMATATAIGFTALAHLRAHTQVPIHAHRAGFGAISRSDQLGMSFRAWQKLARLSGADHVHTNGISNKFYENDAQVLQSIREVRQPLLGTTAAVPVLSSGQWAGLAHATFTAINTQDVLMLAGGGIHGHPDGPVSGVRSMRDAWESAARGETMAEALETSEPFRRAVEKFGAAHA